MMPMIDLTAQVRDQLAKKRRTARLTRFVHQLGRHVFTVACVCAFAALVATLLSYHCSARFGAVAVAAYIILLSWIKSK